FRRHPCFPLFPYTTLFRSRSGSVRAPSVSSFLTLFGICLAYWGLVFMQPSVNRSALRQLRGLVKEVLVSPQPQPVLFRMTRTARSEEHTSELQSLAYLVCR